ncbi:hypothetical protein [Capnocytophaga sp. H4358]|uniref:hypothetical protein n=1 Tax=Capnocytophaga sp. H4358 TaxID=1945658 RepID=UPI0012FFA7CD|nr:hypothetical protein [Capnocytophaga sp. H4358]
MRKYIKKITNVKVIVFMIATVIYVILEIFMDVSFLKNNITIIIMLLINMWGMLIYIVFPQEKSLEKIEYLVKKIEDRNLIVFDNRNSIFESSKKDIRQANDTIKVTSFKKNTDDEIISDYYDVLHESIKTKQNLTYKCCFSKGVSFDSRKKSIERKSLQDNDYEKMTFYKVSHNFVSMINMLIIDDKIVYLGFSPVSRDSAMTFAIKIETSELGDSNSDIVQKISSYYDNVLNSNCKKIYRGKELLKLK